MRAGGTLLLLALTAALLLPAAAAPAASRDAGEVRVDWAAGDVTVGDRVPVDVTVVVPAELVGEEGADGADPTPRFPAWRDTWGEAEIGEVGEVREIDPATLEATAVASAATGTGSGDGVSSGDAMPSGSRRAWRQSLVLTAFRPGSVPLPPREILVPTAEGRSLRLTTPGDLALEVHSVLPDAGEEAGGEAAGEAGDQAPIPEPMDAKSMVALPVGSAFWWTAGAFSLALLAAGFLYYRRRLADAPGDVGARPDLPPAAELHHALAAAREEMSPGEGLAGVSRALRRYLGRRLAFPAMESTTTEVRRHLRRTDTPTGVAARCGEILAACDLVKFARRPAAHDDVRRWADAAAGVADSLEDHLRPADADAADDDTTATRREEAA